MKLSKEAKVGILTVISVGLFYYGFNYLKGIDFFNPTHSFYATYQNVAGLGVSNPVTVNGFTVGRVSDISIDQVRKRVIVRFDINNHIILGDSAMATLTSDILGSKEIRLSVGDINKPIESGDTIKGVLDKGLESLIAEGENIAVSLEETIGKVNTILDSLTASSGDLKEIFKNVNVITWKLKRINFESKIDDMSSLLMGTLSKVDSIVLTLPPILEKVDGFTDTLNNIEINRTLAHLDTTLITLNSVLLKIDNGEGDLGKLINEDSLYTNLNSTLSHLDQVLIHSEIRKRKSRNLISRFKL